MKLALKVASIVLASPVAVFAACGRGRKSNTVGLKESTNIVEYKKTIHRTLGGGAWTSVKAYDSTGVDYSTGKLPGYDDEFEEDNLFSTAKVVMEMDSSGYIALGYKARTAAEVEAYLDTKFQRRWGRRNLQRKKYHSDAVAKTPLGKTWAREERRLRKAAERAAKRALRTTTKNEKGGKVKHRRQQENTFLDEISGTAVLRFGFGCQIFNQLTVGVSNLLSDESGLFRAYKGDTLVESGTFTGSNSGAVEFLISSSTGFDTLEFAVDPGKFSSSFLISFIEYCKPATCTGATAGWSGDPHLTSFDGLRWDCQGWGHFLMFEGVKGNGNDPFQIQAIFDKQPWITRQATVARGVLIDTGEPNTPVLQFSLPKNADSNGKCEFRFYDNGELADLATWTDPRDKVIITSMGQQLACGNRWRSGGNKITVTYPDLDTQVTVWASTSKVNGCVLATNICIGSYWEEATNRVQGMLGNSNGIKIDDWVDRTGSTIPAGVNMVETKKGAAYDFCTNYWCLKEEESKFTYAPGDDFSTYDHCAPEYEEPKIELAVKVEADHTLWMAKDFCIDVVEDPDEREDCFFEVGIEAENCGDDCLDISKGFEAAQIYADDKNTTEATNELEGFYEAHEEDAPEEKYTPSKYEAGGVKKRENSSGPGASGDPHFKLWNGQHYDFHGICDLVLLKNDDFEEGLGMLIHIRSKKTRQWSFISNAVLLIGESSFEVSGATGKEQSGYWINGVAGSRIHENDVKLSDSISGYSIYFKRLNSQQTLYIIDLTGGEKIVFKTWKEMIRIEVLGSTAKNFDSSVGLMGTFKKGIKGLKMARDNQTVLEDVADFGQEWQVLPGEPKLFHNIEGPQSPNRCEFPSQAQLRRQLAETEITLETASQVCDRVTDKDEFDLCVFDVMAVGSIDMANSY